ncbi:hypothetical protein AC578_1470 [Pseudocercospora eumusae]|uniref:Uncharacterized protein n=1 Tax=Pseudocercospora eumusae TaxID=321146 RepID=A0A139H6I5_9PEZI|nr:hypothetical protein AC578_1470 [Pseudocercospora eumusae]
MAHWTDGKMVCFFDSPSTLHPSHNPPTSAFGMADKDNFMFENLDPESLLNNARITWLKDIRASYAEHHISDHNLPTPTLLLELKVLKDLTQGVRDSFLNAINKLFTRTRTNVFLYKDYTCSLRGAFGEWHVVWYTTSKSWFAAVGWDGDISPPRGVWY